MAAVALVLAHTAGAQAAANLKFSLPQAQPLGAALRTLVSQASTNVMFDESAVAGKTAAPLQMQGTLNEALKRLLKDTGLEWRFLNESTVVVGTAESLPPAARTTPLTINTGAVNTDILKLAQNAGEEAGNSGAARNTAEESREPPRDTESDDPSTKGIPEILVRGARSLNTDIARTRDEVQPYVVFDRESLERSGALNLNEFLRNKLPSSSTSYMNSQSTTSGTRSSVNLRGLGSNQTLILIDGRRVGSAVRSGTPQQPDLNSIPLGAIERIEVLPATASGIYGGGATGGVINVVLRHDYSGAEVNLAYDNSFDTDSSIRRADVTAGFALEDDKTHVNLGFSYMDSNPLTSGSRDFVARSRILRLAYNPAAFLSSPPVGATTNIRSANGSPLFGPGTSNMTHVPAGYAGGGGLAPLQANAGGYNLDLADTTQAEGGARESLMSTPRTLSASVTLRRRFTSHLDAFIDATKGTNEGIFYNEISNQTAFTVATTAPTNPFNQAVLVRFPNQLTGQDASVSKEAQTRIASGVLFDLPGQWRGEVDYTWERAHSRFTGPSRLDTVAVTADLNNGTLDPFRDTVRFPLDLSRYSLGPQLSESDTTSTFRNAMLRLSGAVLSLPGGDVALSALLEHRAEDFGAGRTVQATLRTLQPDRSQSIASAYLELNAPLISARNAIPAVASLDLQLAGRYDKYILHGARSEPTFTPATPIVRTRSEMDSTNPTLGLKYQPLRDVALRASYGTGFLPPGINQLAPSASGPANSGLTDPLRNNAPVTGATMVIGGNPDLTPEKSTSKSLGLILTPRVAPGLRLSLDYVRIHKTNNIATHPGSVQGLINDAALFPGRIVRGTDPGTFGTFGVGPIQSIDFTLLNIAQAKSVSYDLQLDYEWPTSRFGTFTFLALATRQMHSRTQLIDSRPPVENVGNSFNNPPKFKANSGFTWSDHGWSAGWNTRYVSSYLVSTTSLTAPANQGGPEVSSQIYHDVFAAYRFGRTGMASLNGALADTELRLGVNNLFNRKPPYDAFFSQFFYSPYGDPRLATYSFSLKKTFN